MQFILGDKREVHLLGESALPVTEKERRGEGKTTISPRMKYGHANLKSFFPYTNGRCSKKVFFTHINLVPSSEEKSFMTTFYDLYFSHHHTHITHYKSCWTFCVGYSCTDIHIQIWTTHLLIFTEKLSPLLGLNLGPPRYQADMLPIELYWLGCS